MMNIKKVHRCLVLLAALIVLNGGMSAYAQQTCSGAYCANEYYFGTGGDADLNSAGYKARAATGALGVDKSTSANYTAEAGTITPDEPYLEFLVNSTTVNLGVLSTLSAGTSTASFSVRNYLSSGYALLSYGTPLTSGSHTFTNLASATTSSAGTEQFGINLIDNSAPNVGTDPVQVPNSSYSFGEAATGYNTLNNFKYVSGDVVASSPKASGRTDFTISYLANISNVTPGGVYTMSHILIVVPTF